MAGMVVKNNMSAINTGNTRRAARAARIAELGIRNARRFGRTVARLLARRVD